MGMAIGLAPPVGAHKSSSLDDQRRIKARLVASKTRRKGGPPIVRVQSRMMKDGRGVCCARASQKSRHLAITRKKTSQKSPLFMPLAPTSRQSDGFNPAARLGYERRNISQVDILHGRSAQFGLHRVLPNLYIGWSSPHKLRVGACSTGEGID